MDLKFEQTLLCWRWHIVAILTLKHRWNVGLVNGLKVEHTLFFCFLAFDFLSVLRGHSVVSSPPQWPMTSDFEGFFIPDFIHYILILKKEPVFSFLMFSAKQGNYLYHFYNVFGMTWSLTRDWTRDVRHSKPALYH